MEYFDAVFSGMYLYCPELADWRDEMESRSALSVLSADLRCAYFGGDR